MGGRLGLDQCPGRGLDVLVRAVAPPGRRCAGARPGRRSADALGPACPGRRRQRDQPEDPAPAAALLGRRGRRGGRRLPGARARAHGGAGRHGRSTSACIDLNMPGMDGIELARALKADPATAETDALPAELLGPPARAGRVPPDRLRRQPDQAGPLVGAVRLPDHRASTRGPRPSRPASPTDRPARDRGGRRE